MNNFTKEELQEIYYAIMESYNYIPEPLEAKILAMIDNYCDHEPENDFSKDPRSRFEKGTNPKCKKCGAYFR